MSHDVAGSVTARLKGGLGNQLFQYAAGSALAKQLNSTLYLDTGFYQKRNNSNRTYKLPDIGISAVSNNVTKLSRVGNQLKSRILPKSINGNINYVSEPADYGFRAFTCHPTQQIYLDGYWQSEKYFIDIRERLLDEIDLEQINVASQAVALPSENTVAVHVRRGDFISSDSSQALSIDYVHNAMREFGNNLDFMFFSDDIQWCKDNFHGNNVSFANNESDLQDLKQMSEAAHNIIANSTFSWWSAWLNKNESQRVIAPQPWTNEDTHKDILPPHWETIGLRKFK
ncbi:MAG: alpha-1,2-fucosyltransferase [Granulosicoccus sp.]